MRSQAAVAQARSLASRAETLPSGAKLLVARLDGVQAKDLQASSPVLLVYDLARNCFNAPRRHCTCS